MRCLARFNVGALLVVLCYPDKISMLSVHVGTRLDLYILVCTQWNRHFSTDTLSPFVGLSSLAL